MFRRASNEALLNKITSYCAYIEYDDKWISVVVLTKKYAATTLHCLPQAELGSSVILCDSSMNQLHTVIHGINRICDYVVLKNVDDEFLEAPYLVCPESLDKYVVAGYAFGEKKLSYRLGQVSSLCATGEGYFYGDSGGLPLFSGGGVFYARNGALMGIARGNQHHGRETEKYGDVLEMISVQSMMVFIKCFGDNPFSVGTYG
ncbi:unnamed protein product [Auanema sp. JU1783]|nr:unnamed protein product [Auanema sp. JU1783]